MQYITEHFSDDISKLGSGGYEDWLQTPLNAVAGIILADQFTRCARLATLLASVASIFLRVLTVFAIVLYCRQKH